MRFFLFFICFSGSSLAYSENSTNFILLKNNSDVTMNVSTYIQTRFELGNLYSVENNNLSNSFDAYFRRARIGFSGNLFYPNLTYGFTFAGDDSIQSEIFSAYDASSTVMLSDIFLNYKINDKLNLKFGKDKLPFSRVYLVSSSKQLFSERPYYTYLWSDYINGYTYPNISVNGNIFKKQINYYFAVGQSWRNGDKYGNSEYTVKNADPQVTLRLEWSPPGLNEKSKSDSNIGKGKHLSVGVYNSLQNNISIENKVNNTFENSSTQIYGIDFSYHHNNFFISSEYNFMKKNISNNFDKNSDSFYFQTGYYLPSYKIEPAFRYERIDSDGSLDVFSLGLNKYFKQQNLKVTLDGEYGFYSGNFNLLKPQNENSRKIIRLTGQFMF